MLNVQVKSKELRKKEGVSKAGKPYLFFDQDIWVELPNDPYPSRVTISHDLEKDAYVPGEYVLAPSSFYVDRFQNLAVKIRLLPKQPAAAGKPAAA